ncbi:MAG: hypothetical protein K2Q12_01995, partial [Rickettsiales bacterium]|nr:hypothetical protein [Rickettsiales bacterium]
AAEEIVRVVREVQLQCRPGYIEIPYDIVDLPIAPPRLSAAIVAISDEENLQAAIEDAVAMINAAKNPVIIADIELHRHNLTDLAVALSSHFNIPIASTLLSKSVVSEQNPLYVGVYSGSLSEPDTQQLVEQSDCIILLGAFLSDVFMGMDNSAALERKRCILATTEKTLVGLRRYESIQLRDFLTQLIRANLKPRATFVNPVTMHEPLALPMSQEADAITVESFFQILEHEMPDDATLICDTGDALLGAIGLRTSQRKNFLSDAYYLSMGFAVPASIGAMAANPESRAIVIAGDGAFQMTGIELSTVAKEGMTPIVCILNNDGYGTQRHIIDGPFNNIHPWNYGKLCELLNYGTAYRVTTKGELKGALQEAVSKNEMALIEVVVPRDDCSRSLRRLGEGLGKLRDSKKRNPLENGDT